MGMRYHKKAIELADILGVDEAEGLLELLQQHPTAKLELQSCTHLHAACLQVLMAARRGVKTWPKEARLARWLQTAFK